jgi:hypothetical protein
MKLINRLIVVGTILILFSCSNNAIEGKWILDSVNVEKAIANFPEAQKDFVRKSMTSAYEQIKGKMKIEFSKDAKFRIETPAQDGKMNVENGTWKLSEDKKTLTTTVDNKDETINVVEISSKKLIISIVAPSQAGEMEMTFVK